MSDFEPVNYFFFGILCSLFAELIFSLTTFVTEKWLKIRAERELLKTVNNKANK